MLRRNLNTITPLLVSCFVVGLGAISCGDNDETKDDEVGEAGTTGQGGASTAGTTSAAGHDTGAGGTVGGEPESPVYVMTSNVWGTDGATGYLYTLPSLSEGEPNLDNAIELPGGAWLTGRTGEPYVYVSSGEGGSTITRWEVTVDGELEKGPTISFAAHGLTNGIRFGTAPIVSPTKAYLLDADNGWVVAWNPSDMKVGKLIELDLEERDGVPATLTSIVAREDRVFVTAAWESDWKWRGGSQVIAIDPATDEIVGTEDETRCEALSVASRASDGTLYLGPQAYTATARAVLGTEFGTSSCALRILPASGGLDDAWEVDLSELAGGRPAGAFMFANDDVGFFRVFYQDEVGATKENWDDTLAMPAYRWWRWTIGTDQAEEIPGQDLALEASHYEVAGKMFLGNPSEDWSATTLVELDAEGELENGVTVQGSPGGVVRVH